MLKEFVTTHQDEDAAEDRWRTKMLKRITGAIHEQGSSLEERIELQQKTLDQMQDDIKRLLGEELGTSGSGLAESSGLSEGSGVAGRRRQSVGGRRRQSIDGF